jgi:hypothetical protein
MKLRVRILLLLLVALLPLCLASCAGESHDPVAYEGEHTHVYGHWYVASAPTPTTAGEQVRYCKICHAPHILPLEYSEP